MTVRDLAPIVIAGALLLVPAAARIDVFNPDEPREAEIAKEMRASGDLIVPHFDGCAFLEKPPLYYWLILGASAIPGISGELAARLPSILAALALLAVTYGIGRELYDRRTGRAAAFLLLTTFQFWWLGKRALLDMTLACFVGACLLCFLKGSRRPERAGPWLLLAGAAGAGALLTKGLIGAMIPGLAILVYGLWRRDVAALFRPACLLAALVPIAALGSWIALLAARPEGACYVREFLVENHVKRFLGGGYGGHAQPVWYYLESLATDFLPWILFLPGAAISLWPGFGRPRPRGRGPGPFLFAWFFPALVLLSLASSKRSIYLLPLAPAASLIVAAWWRGYGSSGRPVPGRGPDRAGGADGGEWGWESAPAGKRGAARSAPGPSRGASRARLSARVPGLLLLLLGVLVSMALPAAVAALLSGGTPRSAGDMARALAAAPAGIPLGAAFLAAVIAVAAAARRNARRGAALALFLTWTLFLVVGAALLPIAGPRLSARSLAGAARRIEESGVRVAACGLTEGAVGQFLFYSGNRMDWIGARGEGVENPCVECRLPTTPEAWLRQPGARACLMPEKETRSLPADLRSGRILAKGTVGGAAYVVLAGPSAGIPSTR